MVRNMAARSSMKSFVKSSATLLAEISNLKTIVSRFSDFSRMPQPQFQQVQVNRVVSNKPWRVFCRRN